MLFVTGLVLHLREWMDQRRRRGVGRDNNPKAATLVHYLSESMTI